MERQAAGSAGEATPVLASAQLDDATAQAAMQPWIVMECYQLSGGDQLSTVDTLDLGRQQIVREHQLASIQKLGVMPTRRCTVSYCTENRDFRFSDLGGTDAAVFFMPQDSEFDIYVPAGAQTAYASFDQDDFLAAVAALDPTYWERHGVNFQQLQAPQQQRLKPILEQWLQMSGRLADGPCGMHGDLLLHHVAQAVSSASPDQQAERSIERVRAFNVCRMARSYIEECMAQDRVPSVVDICLAVGVSERSLQYGFRTYVGMTPVGYLRLRRLNQARAVLSAASPQSTTVTAIAMRFGFLHLGRFAIDYKQLFGQSPSATLAS